MDVEVEVDWALCMTRLLEVEVHLEVQASRGGKVKHSLACPCEIVNSVE
jgi:hypothetical protein